MDENTKPQAINLGQVLDDESIQVLAAIVKLH